MTKIKENTIEYDIWIRWKEQREQDAGNYLVAKYLPLVDFVVHRFVISLPHTVQKDDLTSFGYNGLLDAIEKFDLDRGLLFETYATWRIKGAILDGLRQNDWVPRSVREKTKKIEEAYTLLEQEKLRSITNQELSEYLGMSQDEVNQVITDASLANFLSIDEPIYDDEENQTGRYNLIENISSESPELFLHKQFIKETLQDAIEKLSEKEKIVISLFYYEEMSLTEIAEILGLSTSRISQLHSKAILRLKVGLSKQIDLVRSI